MSIPKVAVRSFIKAYNRSERLAAQHEGAAADHQFDAGEWSDSFHADAFAEIEHDIARRVAKAYGVKAIDLEIAVQQFCYDSETREQYLRFWKDQAEAERRAGL